MFLKRILFFPFALIYGSVVAVRNFLYNKGIKKSHLISGKSIVIGNLSMGGTGKSPHTLYLWNFLKQYHEVAILSRGYGRATKGLIEVEQNHTSNEVGDEPLMFKKRVGESVQVVVSENRKNGVDFIRSRSEKSIILLDDAFQHRKVKAGLSILLTDYSNPFYSDCVVPAGTLREWKCGKNRADCIIVTKCPELLSDAEKENIIKRIDIKSSPLIPLQRGRDARFPLWRGIKGEDKVFFSHIIYGDLIPFCKEISSYTTILLVTGIANPTPLEKHLKRFCKVVSVIFPDHHQFTVADLAKIHSKFDTFASENSIIVTTEKDFVRLETILTDSDKQKYPWYYQSIVVKLDREEAFNTLINNYVDTI